MQVLNLQGYLEYQESTRSHGWFTPSEGATPAQARLEKQVADLQMRLQWLTHFLAGARTQDDGQLKVQVA